MVENDFLHQPEFMSLPLKKATSKFEPFQIGVWVSVSCDLVNNDEGRQGENGVSVNKHEVSTVNQIHGKGEGSRAGGGRNIASANTGGPIHILVL